MRLNLNSLILWLAWSLHKGLPKNGSSVISGKPFEFFFAPPLRVDAALPDLG